MQWKTNNLAGLKKQYIKELEDYYKKQEAAALINILIKSFFGMSRSDLVMNPGYRLSESEILKLHFAVKQLKDYKPVQYIIKKIDFVNVRLMVNESVLIPRPETEELVSMIIDREKEEHLRILDVGTGSGCIAIALAKNLKNPKVYAIDVSGPALKTASKNAFINEVMVYFIHFNILEQNEIEEMDMLDIIVSNPPYVTESDKALMQENVLRFEPHEALFVQGGDPLLFYKAILYFAGDHLNTNGRIYFEVNEQYGKEVAGLLTRQGFSKVDLFQDINGKNRFVAGVKR